MHPKITSVSTSLSFSSWAENVTLSLGHVRLLCSYGWTQSSSTATRMGTVPTYIGRTRRLRDWSLFHDMSFYKLATNSRQEYGSWTNLGKFVPYYGGSIVNNCLSFEKQKRSACFILEFIVRICVPYTMLPLYPWPLEQLHCSPVN